MNLKDRTEPDEKAYATDEEAPEVHNIEPANDEEAHQLRKIRPTPDEEAYVTDKEAVQQRKIEPAHDEEALKLQKNGLISEKEVLQCQK